MPNDYETLRLIALRATPGLPTPTPVAQLPPADYADVRLQNTVGMASSNPDSPLVAGNLPALNSVTLALLDEADVNALLTFPEEVPMGLKIQFEYTVGRQGAREIFYSNLTDAASIPASRLAEYVVRRLAFSGGQTTIRRARVTVIGTRFSSISYTAQQLQVASILAWSNTGNFTAGATTVLSSAAPDECLIVTRSSTTGNRSERFYLSGHPDVAVDDGGQFIPPPTFNTLFGQWNTFVTSQGWGWYGQPSGGNTRVPIITMTNVGGQVVFNLAAPGIFGAGPAYNNTPVRVRGLTQPYRFLNGPLVVLPSSAVACAGIRIKPFPPGAGAPELAGAFMYLQTPPTFYPISSMGVEPYAGSRKRGNPPGEPRGRQRNRVWA